MTFLNPLVLLGLAAAAIPLIIHLFNFRRPRRVDFSSLAFLREVQRSTMQRVRVKQWLLLLLRTLAIAFLVLSFARPVLPGRLAAWVGVDGPAAVAVVVDDSPSMTTRDAAGSYFDQALAAARAIVGTTDAEDEVLVVFTGQADATAASVGPGGAAAAARLADIEPGFATVTLSSAVARAAAVLERSTLARREMYVVSDLQASTIVDTLARPSSSGPNVLLVPVGTRTEANVGVEAVRVVSRVVGAGQPVGFEADVVNHGPSSLPGYVAWLEIEGERVAQATADLEPGNRATLEFSASVTGRGWLSGRVVLEDDSVPFDDERYFTLLVPESRRVLVVEGEGMETGFLRAALDPALAGDRLGMEVTWIAERALASARLSDFDAAVLLGVADLGTGEVERLARHVRDGAGLLVFPTARGTVDGASALLAAASGGRVGAVIQSSGGAALDVVERVELEHPVFEGLFDRAGAEPERVTLFRRRAYEPAGAGENTVMRLAGGDPFLQEIRHGRGTVLWVAVAPDPAWSDLPTRGLFLPLLYRSLFLLTSSGSVEGGQFPVGSAAELFVSRVDETVPLEVVTPAGDRIAPTRRGIASGVLVRLDGTLDRPGTLSVVDGARVVHRAAVNTDSRESEPTRLEPDEAAVRLSRATGLRVDVLPLDTADTGRARDLVAAERDGVEWWNVFLLLALLTLVAESAVAALWKPEAGA